MKVKTAQMEGPRFPSLWTEIAMTHQRRNSVQQITTGGSINEQEIQGRSTVASQYGPDSVMIDVLEYNS